MDRQMPLRPVALFIVAVVAATAGFIGATLTHASFADSSLHQRRPIAEGRIHYIVYMGDDGAEGWTSVDDPIAVPSDRGSWNEHRYGKLYDDYLFVTKPTEENWGALLIPTDRILKLHFRDE